jgi:hypothetical protein
METGFAKWIDALKSIPEFREEVVALQEKYKHYPALGSVRDAERCKQQSEYLIQFQVEVNALDKRIRDWMKKDFPEEANSEQLFWVSGIMGWGMTPIKNYGLDKWIAERIRPADHGGYPGAQWGYDTSIPGQITKLSSALSEAYWKCKSKQEETRKKNEEEEKRHREKQAKQEEEERKQRIARIEEKKKKWEIYQHNKTKYLKEDAARLLNALIFLSQDLQPVYQEKSYKVQQEYHSNKVGKEQAKEWMKEVEEVANGLINHCVKKWTALLIDSISMHWFPERIEKGVRRPGEWKPDFNLDLLAKMEKECGTILGERIRNEAWKKSEEKRMKLLEKETKPNQPSLFREI